MADKDIAIINGEVGNITIKPLFENKNAVDKVTIDEAASDLKGLVAIGILVPDIAGGTITIPLTATAVGVAEAVFVFKYADAGPNANVENWGKSTKTVAITVTAAVQPTFVDPLPASLSMNLWGTQSFPIEVELSGENITDSITDISVNEEAIAGKFEFVIENGSHAFKSISSSTTEAITAVAEITVSITHAGKDYTLTGNINLSTNINDGSIPTDRFDVQFVE